MKPPRLSALLVPLGVVLGPVGAAGSVSWEEALRRAGESREGIVVDLGATWCHACNVLEARTLSDPRVRTALGEGWILVRVDVDRRPDLHRLFHARSHDGLPSLHFLDARGREVMRAGPLGPEEMAATLDHLGRERREGQPLLAVADGVGEIPAGSPGQVLDACRDALLERLDPGEGGFGRRAKYIATPETDFLLVLAATDPARFAPPLARLVGAILESPLHDRVEGGFHRYSRTPDWSSPHYEKLLEVQAVLIEALTVGAALAPGAERRNLEAVRETIAFLAGRLRDPATGLYFASVNADVVEPASGSIREPGESYYARPETARLVSARGPGGAVRSRVRRSGRSGPAPPVDRTLLTSANARLGAALLGAGRRWDQPAWVAAGRSIRGAIPRHLATGDGLLHWRSEEGSAPAFVEDYGEYGLLLLASGRDEDRAAAREIARILRERFAGPDGRLRARPPGGAPGEGTGSGEVADLGDDGARALVFLARLAHATGDGELLTFAGTALERLREARPAPDPAAVGFVAHALARGRAARPASR